MEETEPIISAGRAHPNQAFLLSNCVAREAAQAAAGYIDRTKSRFPRTDWLANMQLSACPSQAPHPHGAHFDRI